jgi:flagellar biogenesis protein FliO
MEFLFGEGQYGLRILVAIFLVLALIGVLAWLVRVFRSERTGLRAGVGASRPD